MNLYITIILLGISVGLGNFAASIGIALSENIERIGRLKLALFFGIFETAMPIIGLLVGKNISSFLGNKANLIGGGLLVISGIYELLMNKPKTEEKNIKKYKKNRLKFFFSAFALSIDNLIIGFSLGANQAPILVASIIIGSISIFLMQVGLEIGSRLSDKFESASEWLGAAILIIVGLLIAFKII